jgi:sortase B
MKQGKIALSKLLIGISVTCLVLALGITTIILLTDRFSGDSSDDYQSPADLIVSLPTESSPVIADIPGSSEDISTEESDTTEDVTEESQPTEPEPSEEPVPPAIENPYKDYYLANSDMVGWLVLPGTVIDYPVMWTPRDENYYLKRDFNGKKSNDGCLILDTDSSLDPLTTNLIIHGHYRKTGAMFTCLHQYEDKDFYEEHKQIILHTEEKEIIYEVVAAFRSQVYRKKDTVFKFYKFFQADNQTQFDDFYKNIKKLSIYDTGVTAEFGDNFITLSTCAYHVENGRFVVVAQEVGAGNTYLPIER